MSLKGSENNARAERPSVSKVEQVIISFLKNPKSDWFSVSVQKQTSLAAEGNKKEPKDAAARTEILFSARNLSGWKQINKWGSQQWSRSKVSILKCRRAGVKFCSNVSVTVALAWPSVWLNLCGVRFIFYTVGQKSKTVRPTKAVLISTLGADHQPVNGQVDGRHGAHVLLPVIWILDRTRAVLAFRAAPTCLFISSNELTLLKLSGSLWRFFYFIFFFFYPSWYENVLAGMGN